MRPNCLAPNWTRLAGHVAPNEMLARLGAGPSQCVESAPTGCTWAAAGPKWSESQSKGRRALLGRRADLLSAGPGARPDVELAGSALSAPAISALASPKGCASRAKPVRGGAAAGRRPRGRANLCT